MGSAQLGHSYSWLHDRVTPAGWGLPPCWAWLVSRPRATPPTRRAGRGPRPGWTVVTRYSGHVAIVWHVTRGDTSTHVAAQGDVTRLATRGLGLVTSSGWGKGRGGLGHHGASVVRQGYPGRPRDNWGGCGHRGASIGWYLGRPRGWRLGEAWQWNVGNMAPRDLVLGRSKIVL